MVKSSLMRKEPFKIYVIDTSYLLELFKVDGSFNEKDAEEIHQRFKKAIEAPYRFIVPLPCLYELGNHVADVRSFERKKELALKIAETIKKSIENQKPWEIVPAIDIGNFIDLWEKFAKEYIECTKGGKNSSESIGLVDATIIEEARKLKKDKSKRRIEPVKVHIWTKDKTLKAHEPDEEENSFTGA
ncbi:PIN domain-containing protein [Thioflexithrix psekupsensis]|uniref:Uncharacterized protein n=1 Tax=Thioflexithrix psekupsensis TaxID=1570016 RepID=A0A251XBI4_9GAMM|nr:PIN domain-containing protein [Thioflexithrix psekupsensis]OUD15450.1 hypothetical protein TPSD3_02685 [Thioflexithrix psekupsensis]